MKKKRVTRSRRTGLKVHDGAEVLVNGVWLKGTVARSMGNGAEVDVRLDDGRTMRNLTSKDVRGRLDVEHLDGEPEDLPE
jgi:hypothetical protein